MNARTRFRTHRPITMLLSALLGGLIGAFTLAGASVAAVSIFHSPNDDGLPGAAPMGGGTHTLHLYVDGGSTPSSAAPCSLEGEGDEVCAYVLDFVTRGEVSFGGFVPTAGGTGAMAAHTLSAGGGDPIAGQLGPAKIGDVTIEVDGDGAIELAWGQAVVADQSLVQLSPAQIVSVVPEPNALLSLSAGSVLLGVAQRRRRAGRG